MKSISHWMGLLKMEDGRMSMRSSLGRLGACSCKRASALVSSELDLYVTVQYKSCLDMI